MTVEVSYYISTLTFVYAMLLYIVLCRQALPPSILYNDVGRWGRRYHPLTNNTA